MHCRFALVKPEQRPNERLFGESSSLNTMHDGKRKEQRKTHLKLFLLLRLFSAVVSSTTKNVAGALPPHSSPTPDGKHSLRNKRKLSSLQLLRREARERKSAARRERRSGRRYGDRSLEIAGVVRRRFLRLLRPLGRVEEPAEQNAPEHAAVHVFDVGEQLAHVAVQSLARIERNKQTAGERVCRGASRAARSTGGQLTTFSDDLRNLSDDVSRVTNGLKMQLITWPSIVRGALRLGA